MADYVFEYSCQSCSLVKHAEPDDDKPRCYGCGETMVAVGRQPLAE